MFAAVLDDVTVDNQELPVEPLRRLRERRSAKWRTFPANVVPLTLAEMDFALAPAVSAALREAIDRSDTGYAVPSPHLGEAVAGFAAHRWSWDVDPARVIATPDVGVGVVELLRVLTRPGQPVVVSPPVYPPFYEWVREAGATVVEVPLVVDDGGWRLDIPALERAFAAGVVAYLMCYPHNPVGRVHTPAELEALVALAKHHGVTLISDEIHAPLVLPGSSFTPLLAIAGAGEVAVTVLAASKAWNLAGLKCAAIVTASSSMARLVERLPAELSWRVGHLGVIAATAAFTEAQLWLDDLLFTLDRRRSQLTSLIAARLPGATWFPPQATYLAWLDCTGIGVGEQTHDLFLRSARVAVDAGSKFGTAGAGHVRLNFATSAEILDAAVAGMGAAAARYSHAGRS